MLPQFLQKLSIKLIILGSVLSGPSLYAQSSEPINESNQEKLNSPSKGLLESFEEKLNVYREDINKKILNPPSDVLTRQVFKDEEKIELSTRQINTILLYSPEYYKELYYTNTCSIYTLLKNRLIHINGSPLINVEAKITNGSEESTAIVPIDAFLAHYYKSSCRLSFKQSRVFEQGLLANSFKKLTPKFPTSELQCLDQFNSLSSNINIDHICSAPFTVDLAAKMETKLSDNNLGLRERSYINSLRREAKKYTSEIKEKDLLYFRNFCSNLNRKENFCGNFSKQDFWGLISNKQRTQSYITSRCQHIFKKSPLSEVEYLRCIKLLRDKPEICEIKGPRDGSVLYPMPNCEKISEALTISRLKNNFNDCPKFIGNHAITNGARVIKHFATNDIKSNDCIFPSYEKIYGLYLESKEEDKWPLKICYKNNDDVKNCLPYIPGNSKDNYSALNMVVANMLFQTKVVSNRIKCQEVPKKKYNPLRIKYKSGCWIVPEEVACRTVSCKYKIMLDNRSIKDIWSEGQLNFDYFKTKYNSTDTAIHDRIINLLRLKEQEINSLSSLKFFLDKKKSGIIHGVGCGEDLYPSHYLSNKIGICTPIPFIVDGHKEINNNTYLSFRGAIDDVTSPRLMLWANVFTALSRYSTLGPLKTWEFYGIY